MIKTITYTIPSRREAVRDLCRVAVETVKRMHMAIDYQELELVLNETLTNALLYGNLRMPGDLRESRGEDVFWKTVDQREQDSEFHSKEIVLRMECLEDGLLLAVRDQGDGFDWKGLMSAMDADKDAGANHSRLLATHGRGLFIVRHYVDELAWNEKGNEVRFAMKFSPDKSDQQEGRMELRQEKTKDVNMIHPKGNLNMATAQDFFSQMIGLLQKGEKKFLLDLSSLESIDSIGLGTLVRLSKRTKEAEAQLRISNPNPGVLKVFELTKLDKVFELYATQEEAMKGF